MSNRVLESQKKLKGVSENEKNVFLKNGLSDILPKIKYGISGPQGDLLHWNLSWSFTCNILVYHEGSDYTYFSISLSVWTPTMR